MNLHDFNILIVDDEIEYTKSFSKIISLEGFSVHSVSSGKEALYMLSLKDYHLVLTDFMMDDMNGIQLIEAIKDQYDQTRIILMTAYATIDNAIEAMKKGADSYYVKGNDPEELIQDILNIYDVIKTDISNKPIDQLLIPTSNNEQFSLLIKKAEKAAKSHANILLLGESGVGKEVFAKYIHHVSTRSEHAFVPVNCHALQETVLESELFGHSKGAFTGATQDRVGRFESADGGTMFLDEIADTSLSTQSKLLRVLDTKTFEKIGSNEIKHSNFRLISATNKNIQEMIQDGSFREDFYYRISTIVLEIPPLRERPEDIKDLIYKFAEQTASELGIKIISIAPEVISSLEQYNFPGNIRELKNIIERLVIFCDDTHITLSDLPSLVKDLEVMPDTLKERRRIIEKAHILKILQENDYKMEKSAEILGITRRQLTNKVTEYDLRKK